MQMISAVLVEENKRKRQFSTFIWFSQEKKTIRQEAILLGCNSKRRSYISFNTDVFLSSENLACLTCLDYRVLLAFSLSLTAY